MSEEEIKLTSLNLLGFIWEENLDWGDVYNDMMIKGDGLDYVASKIRNMNQVGQGSALKALCFISRSGHLIPEFLGKDIINSILVYLNSKDPNSRVYSAEILKNVTGHEYLLDYVDVKNQKKIILET